MTKLLLLLCHLFCLYAGAQGFEREFDMGNGETLSFVVSDRSNENGIEGDDSYDLDFDAQIRHDCNTIRPLNQKNIIMEDWVQNGRNFKTKKLEKFVKYNHAYGIPVLGIEGFTEDSMRRACYLVRFIFAGNEGFRRMAYRKKMYLKGQAGGFCCPANVGNGGLSCPCLSTKLRGNTFNKKTSIFPLRQIFASAHEMAHWYIKYLFAPMYAEGLLKLPQFVNSTEWSWTKAEDLPCSYNKITPVTHFLINSLQQDQLRGTTMKWGCNTHHYFIYTGQDNWLGFGTGNGQTKEEKRAKLRETNPNLANLLAEIWPCNNYYISVCEDAAHGFTKGLAQKLLIGKATAADPSQMTCLADVDTPELTDVATLSPLPTEDVSLPGKEEGFFKKCQMTIAKITKKKKVDDLAVGEIAGYLGNSNEYAWWLRKCCAKTAKFF